jgi:hypothetical protein
MATKRAGGGVAPNRILSRVRALVLGVKGHGHGGGGGSWELLLPAGAGREGATDRPLVFPRPRAARREENEGPRVIHKFIRVTLRNPRRRANNHLFTQAAGGGTSTFAGCGKLSRHARTPRSLYIIIINSALI